MATIEGEPVPSTFEEIARKLRGDDVYTVLKKVFLAKGRGRRPDLPTLSALDNSLLLQVYLLKEEGDKTFDDAAAFLLNLFPDLTESRLRCLMSETKLNWEKQNTIQLQEDFLKKRHDTTGVGPHLQQLEISRQQLLTGDCHLASLQSPTKGLLLDLESFRKREGSTFEMMCRFHHSSINLLKRNKSISQFLMTESKVVQDQLLELSAKKAPASRKKHVQEAKEAVARRELILQEHRDKRTEAEQKRQQKIRDTMAKLASHQGPCVRHDDVNRLLSVHTTAASRLQAVKAEILYQKIVLKHSSPLLKVTGTLPQLVQNLKLFLGADEQNAAANIPPPARQPRKRQRCVASSDSELSATSDSVSESDVASDSGSREDEAIPAFSFDRPGEMVAVFYWDDFFVGEVTRIDSAEEAEVNFLERSKGAGVLLRWPMREDRCVIKSESVFAGGVVLVPSSSSKRAFMISSPANIGDLYQRFKNTLL